MYIACSGICHCHYVCSLHSTGDGITKLLLEEAKMDPNANNNDGDTPLHAACRSGSSKQVKLLVRDERFNPHVKNSRGDTALHVAFGLKYGGRYDASFSWYALINYFCLWLSISNALASGR